MSVLSVLSICVKRDSTSCTFNVVSVHVKHDSTSLSFYTTSESIINPLGKCAQGKPIQPRLDCMFQNALSDNDGPRKHHGRASTFDVASDLCLDHDNR